jgi:hypothetical protein
MPLTNLSCGRTCIGTDALGIGTYSITYTISDGNGNSNNAVLTVNITSSGGPPL